MTKKIIIADTNWWISLVIARLDNSFATILLRNDFEFYSSEELETEIINTFKKTKLQQYISDDILKIFWQTFHLRVITFKPVSVINICRDPKDNFLLALSKDTKADFLITGDKDLLILKIFENTVICTLTQFIENHLDK